MSMTTTLKELQNIDVDGSNAEKPKTKEVLKDMLTENTGRHLLDSGSAYGRNFEENQNKDFESGDGLTVDFYDRSDGEKGTVEILPTVELYHYLMSINFEYTERSHKLTKLFYEGLDESTPYLQEMKNFIGPDAVAVNTYNHEFNNLSQIIQFVPFTVEMMDLERERLELEPSMYGDFVILQVHGGCDVRGGYTAPVIFEAESSYLTMGADSLQISGDGVNVDLIEHEMYELDLWDHDLRAVPRDLKDEVDPSDDVDFLVDPTGEEVHLNCGFSSVNGGRSVDVGDLKESLQFSP